jgi:hypothetical protein
VDAFSGGEAQEDGLGQRLSTPVTVEVFDVLGRRVSELYRQRVIGSAVTLSWDGHNQAGRALPSGLYFLRVSVGDISEVRKVMLIR